MYDWAQDDEIIWEPERKLFGIIDRFKKIGQTWFADPPREVVERIGQWTGAPPIREEDIKPLEFQAELEAYLSFF